MKQSKESARLRAREGEGAGVGLFFLFNGMRERDRRPVCGSETKVGMMSVGVDGGGDSRWNWRKTRGWKLSAAEADYCLGQRSVSWLFFSNN